MMSAWSRLAMLRSGSLISSIRASTTASLDSSESSRARSRMAARSSVVSPFFLTGIVSPSAGFPHWKLEGANAQALGGERQSEVLGDAPGPAIEHVGLGD